MNLILITIEAFIQTLSNDITQLEHVIQLWIVIMLITTFICFVTGELTKNYSQTDKLWSLMPIVYSLVTLYAFPSSPRIWLMTLLVTTWGLRLTYNFYRKGGYNIIPWKGEEDYRWRLLRKQPVFQKGFRITLFNLLFISFYQHLLIFLFCTPILIAAKNSTASLSGLDYLAASCMFLFILIETMADNQLYDFHTQKRQKIFKNQKYKSSLDTGFLTEGLWNYVRHPNFIAEQAIWVSFYFFGIAASGQWVNWSLAGPVLLILLFAGSSEFTERISLEKYPGYKNYKQQVPKFIPVVFRFRKKRNSFSKLA